MSCSTQLKVYMILNTLDYVYSGPTNSGLEKKIGCTVPPRSAANGLGT